MPNAMPDKYWLEGLLIYFENPYRKNDKGPGFAIGQRIIGLYLAELLLKSKLDELDIQYPQKTHNLSLLLSKLPIEIRRQTRRTYKEILNNKVNRTWSFARRIDSLLGFLGTNPFRDTRFLWSQGKNSYSHVISVDTQILTTVNLRTLVYSLFIPLHGYPQWENQLGNRFETQFINHRRTDKSSISLHLNQLIEDTFFYFLDEYPYSENNTRVAGFVAGRMILGLHLIEMILKLKLKELEISFTYNHDLLTHFNKLPPDLCNDSELKYKSLLKCYSEEAWDFAKSIKGVLQFYGSDAITDARYFWDSYRETGLCSAFLYSPRTIFVVILAILITMYEYPEHGIPAERYETVFTPFDRSM